MDEPDVIEREPHLLGDGKPWLLVRKRRPCPGQGRISRRKRFDQSLPAERLTLVRREHDFVAPRGKLANHRFEQPQVREVQG